MQTALRFTGTVQPGGRVEVSNPELPAGKAVDVIVLFSQAAEGVRRSVTDVITESSGHLAFQSAVEVDTYIREERDAWDR